MVWYVFNFWYASNESLSLALRTTNRPLTDLGPKKLKWIFQSCVERCCCCSSRSYSRVLGESAIAVTWLFVGICEIISAQIRPSCVVRRWTGRLSAHETCCHHHNAKWENSVVFKYSVAFELLWTHTVIKLNLCGQKLNFLWNSHGGKNQLFI